MLFAPMFIIFGTTGITYNKENGEFYCPQCDTKRPHKHKRVRRFFTLYFIPLIPLDLLGEYIECQNCRGTYDLKVLEFDPESQAQEFEVAFHAAVRRLMILMMLADGKIDAEEITTIGDTYQKITGNGLTESAIREEASRAEQEGLAPDGYLRDIAPGLNDHGKEMVIRAAFMVALADGVLAEEEMQLLEAIGQALDLSPAHFKGIMSEIAPAGEPASVN